MILMFALMPIFSFQKNEGTIYIRATLPNSVNLDESVKLTQEMKRLLRQFNEVEYILTQTGRPNGGTDATGFFNIEFHLELKPERDWTRKISKDAVLDEMQAALEVYPGIVFGFSQPIQDNVEEYMVGVGFSIHGRDLGSAIADARHQVGEAVNLPKGTRMEWAGEFESQQRAVKRLMVIVPSALLLSLFVLYITFGTIRDSLIVASSMPYAFIGGLLSIMISGMMFGISVGVGFIIMFGIVSIDNIVLVTSIKRILRQKRNLTLAIDEGVRQRLHPVMMTSLISAIGLAPAALSTGIGSEVQRPLAMVIVGGQVFCMILSFTVLPQVFYFAYRHHRHVKK